MNRILSILITVFIGTSSVISQPRTQSIESPYSFLSTASTGAYKFLREHPTYDGRGVVIIIIDTGVDMGVSGLRETSTGEVKVIEVRDFSGQGDISIVEAEIQEELGEEYLVHPDGLKLSNFRLMMHQPSDGIYWMGILEEKNNQNSNVHDLNNNGSYSDKFGIVTFEVESNEDKFWVCYVDTDGDGSLGDENPLRDYNVNYDTFQLRGRDTKSEKNLLTFALNIFADEKIVSLHFDDGSHGTHVAGIASGYNINGQEGLNGIAPGAKIISCKIGDNRLSGGCTTSGSMKSAYEFGIQYAKEYNVPVIFNMSYGIDSETEGRSDIENYLNSLLEENEDVFIVTSAGNSGPGISSMGNPAASSRIFSVGALFPAETARDLYGAIWTMDKITYFSARGGEINKPDVIAPGYAASTVPAFASRDRFGGTSMAAPQAAGAAALLVSAALQQEPAILCKNALLRRALKFTARELPEYTYLDQGNGIINIPAAFDLLKHYAEINEGDKLLDYEITTTSPIFSDSKGETAYWRANGYFPRGAKRQVFSVKAIFPQEMKADDRNTFYRTYELRSTASWLNADQKNSYIKGEQPTEIHVYYDESLLSEPGMYVGKIQAYNKDRRNEKFQKDNTEFELLSTIIVPYRFGRFSVNSNYQREWNSNTLSPGDITRYFIHVPPEASSVQVQAEPTTDKWCNVYLILCDPNGHEYSMKGPADNKSDSKATIIVPNQKITSGIWEVIAYAPYQNKSSSTYNLSISFTGLKLEPPVIIDFSYSMGKKPTGSFTVTNIFSDPFEFSVSGVLSGYCCEREHKVKNSAVYNVPIKISDIVNRAEFSISLSKEIFNKFTDVAINIKDKNGKTITRDAMGLRKLSLDFSPPAPGEYTLEIVGGFTHPESEGLWTLLLQEKYFYKNQIPITVDVSGNNTLYSDMPVKMNFTIDKSPPIAPEEAELFGEIEFKDRVTKMGNVSLPIKLKTTIEN